MNNPLSFSVAALNLKRILLFSVFLILVYNYTGAQEKWSSPELRQMYLHACEYSKMGNLNDAIITFKQAIKLDSGNLLLWQGLGEVYYKEKNFKEVQNIIDPLLMKRGAGPGLFALAAKAKTARGYTKKAKATLDKGFELFPASGLLYNELGLINKSELKTDESIEAWKHGMDAEPSYSTNYYELALCYFSTDRFLDGILCGELFVNIEQSDTEKINEIKKMLFTGYKFMFDNMVNENSQHKNHKTKNAPPFLKNDKMILDIYSKLTPVVSDGITTENLTMVRTRFLMDLFLTADNDPFPLFRYQDDLVRNGWFDIYNEWLFGSIEDTLQFHAWNTFHAGVTDSFLDWRKDHPFMPKDN